MSRPLALVTGASSGVGIDFARELARRGYDLILTARRADRLAAVQQDLQDQFGIRVESLRADLQSAEEVKRLFTDAQQLGPVSVLINNAGLGRFGDMVGQSIEDLEAMIQVNATSLTLLTRLFGAEMVSRGEGWILNTGSYSAIQPTPLYAVYSGTKGYVLAFSQALQRELQPHGVHVSVLCPGFFRSEFQENAGQTLGPTAHLLLMSSESVARTGISGLFRGKVIIVPDWRYKLLNVAMRALPRTTASRLAEFSLRH